MSNSIKTAQKYTLSTLLFLYPIFFLPLFINPFETSKLLLLVLFSLIFVVLKLIEFSFSKKLSINVSKVDISLFLLFLTYLLSGILVSKSPMDSFFNPGTSSFVTFGVLIYFFVNQFEEADKKVLSQVLVFSAVASSLLQTAAFLGILKMIPMLPSYLKADVFTPFGNLINSTVFTIVVLPFSIFGIIKTSSINQRIINTVTSFFLIISLFISIYLLLPNKPTSFQPLDLRSSWLIGVDTLKQNVFGVGAGNYSIAFLKSKPIEVNIGDKWSATYQQGFSTFFTIFTETGIIGLVISVVCLFLLLKKMEFTNSFYISLIILTLSLLSLPLTQTFLPIVFLIFALNSHTKNKIWEFKYAKFLAIPFLALIIYLGYIFSRIFFADILFFRSVSAAVKNDGKTAYSNLSKAISINPKVDTYHLVKAEINLNLAQNLSQKEKLEEKDKKDIATLIQSAVSEGKAAVKLNPQKASNWEGLANIYQTIIPYAKGSVTFAVQSYNQAIFLSPLNPQLRLRLGGIYYNFKKYDEAIDAFKLATMAKNNLPNAHYNLAAAYRENKQTDKAIEEMQKVLTLVTKDSADYQKAQEELNALKQKKAQVKTEDTQNLNLPKLPEGSSNLPQVDIPQQ